MSGIQVWALLEFPWWLSSKEAACNVGATGDMVDPWVRKIPWRRAWQPTPVFLPGESHGQRSLARYSLWGHKESDMTEATSHGMAFQGVSDVCLGAEALMYLHSDLDSNIIFASEAGGAMLMPPVHSS